MNAAEARTQERRLAALCLQLSYATEALESIVGAGDADDARLIASEALAAIERAPESFAV